MIIIDENYRIENDVNNFILKYEKRNGIINEKTGKETTSSDEWYFPNIKLALIKYFNESLKTPETITEVLDEIKRVETLISKMKF
jgi:hypothetical protein